MKGVFCHVITFSIFTFRTCEFVVRFSIVCILSLFRTYIINWFFTDWTFLWRTLAQVIDCHRLSGSALLFCWFRDLIQCKAPCVTRRLKRYSVVWWLSLFWHHTTQWFAFILSHSKFWLRKRRQSVTCLFLFRCGSFLLTNWFCNLLQDFGFVLFQLWLHEVLVFPIQAGCKFRICDKRAFTSSLTFSLQDRIISIDKCRGSLRVILLQVTDFLYSFFTTEPSF